MAIAVRDHQETMATRTEAAFTPTRMLPVVVGPDLANLHIAQVNGRADGVMTCSEIDC